jgi:hypothetical protein
VKGRITARQYIEASKQIRPGRRLGAILVELEAIEPDELMGWAPWSSRSATCWSS